MNPSTDFSTTPDMEPHAARVLQGEYLVPTPAEPATVLDIGANDGAFSVWASRRWPSAQIFAYEPQLACRERFLKNCGNGRVHLASAAVRSFNGRDLLRAGLNNSGEASFHDVGGQTKSAELVEVIAAGSLPVADFVKLDTEGCELEILESLDLSHAQAVALEYHREKDLRAIIDQLIQKGFFVHSCQLYGAGRGLLKFTKGVLKDSVFVGVPTLELIPAISARCFMDLAVNYRGRQIHGMMSGDADVCRARNTITQDFLESNCTHLMFIDSDLVFTPQDVRRLMDLPEPLVGGMYPKKKQGETEWVCNALESLPPRRADGLQQLATIGTGFMRIGREVFDAMRLVVPTYRTDQDYPRQESQFWAGQVVNGRYMSEDWLFCYRWRQLGGEVWGDTRTVISHRGSATYPLETQWAKLRA